jgi:CMP-N,N'-diacetyllegionaminic acid synthase
MIGNKRIVAIIPARGGSKRLPRKNILDLVGKPLIAWTIEAGLKSKYVDRVIVSTDDEEIAEISKKYGADVPFIRPMELAGDTSSSMSVVRHAIQLLREDGDDFEYILLLQPTSPLRTEDHINEAIQLLIEKKADGVVSIVKVDHPMEWTNTLPEDCSMDGFLSHEMKGLRGQDFPTRYLLNGSIYISKIEKILTSDSMIPNSNCYGYIMNKLVSVDVDTYYEYKLSEFLMKETMTNSC